MYVIVDRNGEFVTRPGQESSYTRKLERAWVFARRETANAQACGNEQVFEVESLFVTGVEP